MKTLTLILTLLCFNLFAQDTTHYLDSAGQALNKSVKLRVAAGGIALSSLALPEYMDNGEQLVVIGAGTIALIFSIIQELRAAEYLRKADEEL